MKMRADFFLGGRDFFDVFDSRNDKPRQTDDDAVPSGFPCVCLRSSSGRAPLPFGLRFLSEHPFVCVAQMRLVLSEQFGFNGAVRPKRDLVSKIFVPGSVYRSRHPWTFVRESSPPVDLVIFIRAI